MTYSSMGPTSLSCSEQPTIPRVRRQYSSSSMTSSSTSYTHSRDSRSKITYGYGLPELQEDDDSLGALPASISRMSMPGGHDKPQALPLKARSSLGSIRSSIKRTTSIKRGPRMSTSSIAEAHYNDVLREDFISSFHAPASLPPPTTAPLQAQSTRKKSSLKSMFSFAPFSRRSTQGVHNAQQQENVQEAGRSCPSTSVDRWTSTLDKQSNRNPSLSSCSGSRSSGSLPRLPPNARRPTNSIISGNSKRDSLATSSRASSQTNMSARQQRGTPSPTLTSLSPSMLGQLLTPPPHITIDRSSSPTPSHGTRRTSYSSTHDDVVIYDAAATSIFAVGRPKSVYGHRISALATEPVVSEAAATISRKVSINRPRPQVLQLAHKPQRSNSPGSASSSTPSLSHSRGTPQSMTPPSSPGTPDTSFADMSSPFHLSTTDETKPTFRSWMDVTSSEHSPLRRAMPIPPRSSSTNHNKDAPASSPTSSSLSSSIATALRPGSSHNNTSSIRTSPPTSPNPYTTHSLAPFPTPSSTSAYASASTSTQHFSHSSPSSSTSSSSTSNTNSSTSTTRNTTYFTLPPSSSAHPDLYPDLKGKTVVGMALTEEESRLIARMREKRREMRREELGRLRVALGVVDA